MFDCGGGGDRLGARIHDRGSSADSSASPRRVSVNLDRAVEHWRQGQSPFGVLGIGVETAIVTARDTWYRHARRLASLKVHEGVA